MAVKSPSAVVTVIVAVPLATAVTLPFASTVATASLLDVQVTVLFVALAGETVAVIVPVAPPAVNVNVSLSTLIALTFISSHLAYKLTSFAGIVLLKSHSVLCSSSRYHPANL